MRGAEQDCQMAKFDPFLSLDCARVEGVGARSKEKKGSNFAAWRSGAIVFQAQRAKHIQSKNPAIAIWQPCSRRNDTIIKGSLKGKEKSRVKCKTEQGHVKLRCQAIKYYILRISKVIAVDVHVLDSDHCGHLGSGTPCDQV